MPNLLTAYLAIFTPVLLGGIGLGWIAHSIWASWRAARAVIASVDEPVPVALADAGLDAASGGECGRCRPGGGGLCECATGCGHAACFWAATARDGLTAKDMRWLAAHETWRSE